MPTDREYLKQAQAGHVASTGISDAIGAVNASHEESFTWVCAAGAVFAESPIAMTKKGKVVRCRIVAITTLAAHASNNITCTLAKRDSADFTTADTIGTVTTDVAGGALTQWEPKTMTISNATNAAFNAGDVLTYKTVDNGTTTEPGMVVTVDVEYV